jgi:small subunit ribosomal protein S9
MTIKVKKDKEQKSDQPKRKRGRPKKSAVKEVFPVKEVKKEEKLKLAVQEAKEVKKEIKLGSKKRDKYYYAIGRRKRAVATVRIYKEGEDKITVNNKDFKDYFPYFEFEVIALAPLKIAAQEKRGNISIKVQGGGLRAQAEAVRLGLARALITANQDWRLQLKKAGFLSRDSREKERKKPGLKRARRAPQWSKR